MGENDSTHTTEDELFFLDRLGSFVKSVVTSRYRLLKNYLAAMKYRENWGGMDHYRIKMYVLELIETEEKYL